LSEYNEVRAAAVLLPISSVASLKQVDTDIFKLRYFGHCMQCTFCHDSCCQYGCDVNLAERDRILGLKDELQPYVGVPADQWFKSEVFEDPEYETGKFVRSQVHNNRCAFINPNGRGCGIHTFALKTGRDYHAIKPLVCWLFPVTWDKGVLRPSYDVTDDLVCRDTGATLYEFSRDEIRVVFGEALVAELDAIRPSA
jgi:Fe-S-cluster containining protein